LHYNWLCCGRRRRCADVIAVNAQASSPSSRLQLLPSVIVTRVARHQAGVVVIVVVVVVISLCAVAIVVDFVARCAIAIVIDVVVCR
jgi:hypothetical protein